MTVTKKRDEEDESLLTTTPNNHSQQQLKRQMQQGSSERLKKRNGETKKKSANKNEPHQISKSREDEKMLRPNMRVEAGNFPGRVEGMREEIEMELLGYQTIVYIIFLVSALVLVVPDYGISDDCGNLKRFDIVFFVTAACGFFVMMWTVLIRSIKPDCFLSSCSCFPLLVVNLMLLAIFITLGAGELFDRDCGAGWARGWLTMYWIYFVFIFPLVPLIVKFVRGCYLYWYHLLVMQVVYIAHAMDVWFRGEDNAIPEYTPYLTLFFVGSSAWVLTMYVTTYRYLAILWCILGYGLSFLSTDAVWRLGGPHGLEAQILLVVFNLLVTYILWYRLYEMLSPFFFRKDVLKLGSVSEDVDQKIRLSLRSSFMNIFKRSLPEHTRKIVKSTRGKGLWSKSEWIRVNNKDEAEIECMAPDHSRMGSLRGSVVSDKSSAFKVQTQFHNEYDGSTDDEVRIHIQESDEDLQQPQQIPATRVLPLRHQSLPNLRFGDKWHKEENTDIPDASEPLLSAVVHVVEKASTFTGEFKDSESPSPDHQGFTSSMQNIEKETISSQPMEDSLLLAKDYSQGETEILTNSKLECIQDPSTVKDKGQPGVISDGGSLLRRVPDGVVVEMPENKEIAE